MNVLISLKSRLIGEALRELLNQDNGCDLFVVANMGRPLPCERADVIIVDHVSLNEEIHADWPEAKIILLDTGLPQEEVTTLVLTHGLHGVLSTDEDAVLARKALRLVHEGQIWINNSNLKALLSKAGTISRNARVENVSRREKEVLEQILKGRKNKEIAVELLMSEQTVKAHLSHIFKKFKVSSRTQLVSLLMNNSHENVHISEHPSSFFST